MAMKPPRPCRHPGCGELTKDGYCPKHKPKQAARRESAQWHSWYSLPIWTDDPAARSAAPGAFLPGVCPTGHPHARPLTWTMCGTTGETGCCLQTGTTCKAFATPATAARPCGSCGKTGRKIQAVAGGERASFGRGCAAWARRRAWARNFSKFPSPAPHRKSFGGMA